MTMDFLPQAAGPSKIGRYEVAGKLAAGGMAELLLACRRGDGGFERPVVIKRILPHLADVSDFTAMFMDEARIAASIRHANVVTVHELERDEDGLYLVMEYLEGESAANLMRRLEARRLKLDPAIAAYLVGEACAGLHAAHELAGPDGAPLGLVHRDVSPENVFVTYGGAVKVVDFGIAMAADRIAKTEVGQIKGKFRYMSPEQVAGDPLDRRSDVFALGITLFELATGHRLFARASRVATMKAITDAPVPPPSLLNPAIPPALDAIALRALERDPAARWRSAAEMRMALHRFLHGAGSAEVPYGDRVGEVMSRLFADRIAEKQAMLRRMREGADVGEVPSAETDLAIELPTAAGATVATPTTEAAPLAAPVRRRSGRGALAAALAAATLAAALGAGAFWWTRPRAEVPTPAAIERAAPAAPAEVGIRIETVPPGARVRLDGTARGETPLELRLPRSASARALTLEHDGFTVVEESLTPDVDQRLSFTLAPEPAAPPTSPPARRRRRGRAAPAAPEEPSFERFD